MQYFKVDWHVNDEESDALADIDVIPATEVPWTLGVPWAPGMTAPKPIEFVLDADRGTEFPDAFLVGIPLFSPRFVSLLRDAGVDNLDLHDATIVDPRSGTVNAEYKAVNIVGAIACADLAESEYDPQFTPPSMEFRKLVVDVARARDRLFFRLAENTGCILAREDIAKRIVAGKFKGIRVVALSDPSAF